MSLIGASVHTLTDGNNPVSVVSAQQDTWSLTLQITESAGAGNTVILGGSPNASNGQDDLDLPKPPPPLPPCIDAWFTTPFSVPFNDLLHEYKHTPLQHTEWNLSIRWVPESENDSKTTIKIVWDSTRAAESDFDSFKLYDNTTVVANLLAENSFSFPSNGTLHHFKIIGESSSTNGTTEKNDLPILPLLLGISVLIIVILIAVFIYYKRIQKKRNEYNEKVRKRIQQQHLEEINKLLDEQKNLSTIKEKIQNWKNQGYNVEELEKIIEEQEEKRGKRKKKKKETGKNI